MKILTTTEAIQKAIKSIAVRGAKLDNDIHVAGVSCLQQIADHSNTTLLNELVVALPKGARKTAFVEWALSFGAVRVLDKGNEADQADIAKGRVFKLDRTKETNIQGAIDNAWYNFKPEGDVLDHFDVNAVVAQLMKKLQKAKKQGLKLEGVQDAQQQLRAIMQQLDVESEVL